MVPGKDTDIPDLDERNGMLKKARNPAILGLAVSICFLTASGMESLPRFEQPVLITSAGQSADVQIGNVLAKRAGLPATLSKDATQKDLGDKKTLILVIGVSMKGLGAAGLDIEQEKNRVRALIDEAKNRGIALLCLHLGGEARRGDLSDQMIQTFLPEAQMAIVVKSGNTDGLFTSICQDKNIPLCEVERAADVQKPLEEIFSRD